MHLTALWQRLHHAFEQRSGVDVHRRLGDLREGTFPGLEPHLRALVERRALRCDV